MVTPIFTGRKRGAALLDLIRTLTPFIMFILGGLGIFATVWLRGQFASKEQFRAETTRVDRKFDDHYAELVEHGTAIQLLKQASAERPSRHELADLISSIGQRTAGVEEQVKGMSRRLDTANVYLQTLIERGMNGTGK